MDKSREAASASYRVLLVEDEYYIADDIARSLRTVGAEVIGPVATRDEALAMLASEQRLDAAVIDINLQGEMAYPVADALHAQGIPFVFSTGYHEASIPPAYRNVPRWEKPFELEQLMRSLPGLKRQA